MRFSTRLRNVLKEKGMTQTELSKRTGISKSVISEWLSDKYEPKQDKIYMVAEALSVSPSWLFGVSDNKEVSYSITTIYNQLSKPRQQKVYNFAERQLEQQNHINEQDDYYGRAAAGAPMMSILDRKKEDGTRLKRYRCKSKKKYPGSGKNYSHLKCDNTSHLMDVLEDYVIDQIEKLRIEPDNFDFNHTESNDKKIKIHENELARLEGMLNKVLDLYINGDIPKDNLNQRREKINEDIAKNEAALEELKADNEDEMKKNALNELNKLDKPAKTLSYEEKFKLVRKLLKEVTVYKDKVVLDWAFSVTKS